MSITASLSTLYFDFKNKSLIIAISRADEFVMPWRIDICRLLDSSARLLEQQQEIASYRQVNSLLVDFGELC